jgi:hypothetical protein
VGGSVSTVGVVVLSMLAATSVVTTSAVVGSDDVTLVVLDVVDRGSLTGTVEGKVTLEAPLRSCPSSPQAATAARRPATDSTADASRFIVEL